MPSRTRPEPVFFVDRDLAGKRFVARLRDAELEVESHLDHFEPACPDIEWLREAGARNWVVLSHNKKIRYNAVETAALMNARVRAFMLIGDAPQPELADNFVATLGRVLEFLAEHEGPFIAKVSRPSPVSSAGDAPGRVEMWLSFAEWRDWQDSSPQPP